MAENFHFSEKYQESKSCHVSNNNNQKQVISLRLGGIGKGQRKGPLERMETVYEAMNLKKCKEGGLWEDLEGGKRKKLCN